jgi:GTP-binding protein
VFIDEVVVSVKAGDGGNGCMAFRREKFVPRGGPSGGDGGHGGDITLIASEHYNTLLHFRFNPEHSAQRGRHGEGSNRTGRDGAGIELPVPVGTEVHDAETGELLFDFTAAGQRWIAAHGGRGGKGNARFATATHQAPTEHEEGKPGEFARLRLTLKLLADVGLVGFPNAGKSTLISRLSSAKPKIADYPFTTLTPNLGVVEAGDNRTFVMADVPGLIEGAHEGHGLGMQFLRHIERTRVLVHLVDVSDFTGRDPAHDFDVILNELAQFGEHLLDKPMIVAASKVDACQDSERIRAVEAQATERGYSFLRISSATGEGIEALRFAIAERLFAPAAPNPDATIAVGS